MTWFKVDDAFWGHPKQTALPAGPVALWVRAGSWSSDQLTDGLVPAHMVTMLGAKKRDAEQLVAAGLWDAVPEGYQFHDWSEWQPSREEVHAKRAEEAERKRKWREKRAADKAAAQAAVPNVSQRDNSVASGGTDAGVPDLSRSSRTRPDPTRPEPSLSYGERDTSGTTVEGGSHVSRDSANDAPPAYPDHCPDHQEPVPPKCGGCAKQKEHNRITGRHLTAVADDAVFARPTWCGKCNEFTRLTEPDDGPSRRCDTCHPLAVAS